MITCHALVSERIIHPDDAGEFLKHTRLSDLRDQLFSKKKSEFTCFRSEVEAKTSVIAFGMLVPPDCSEANPWAVVLIGFDPSLDLIAKNMKEIYRQGLLDGIAQPQCIRQRCGAAAERRHRGGGVRVCGYDRPCTR